MNSQRLRKAWPGISLCTCVDGMKSAISQVRNFVWHWLSHSSLNTSCFGLQQDAISKSVKNKNQLCIYCSLDIVDTGVDLEGWSSQSPPSWNLYESNFFYNDSVQLGKQHSRWKAILRPLFCQSSVAKYTSSLLQ